jgi:hypothetical protein
VGCQSLRTSSPFPTLTTTNLPLPALAEPAAQDPCPPRPKITSFFSVETAEEKAVRLERDHREFLECAKKTVSGKCNPSESCTEACGWEGVHGTFVKVEVARKGEPQGNVFGVLGHERGGYKRLLKQGNT